MVRPKAGPGADWFHVRGQVPRGRSRLANQATAKLFAQVQGKALPQARRAQNKTANAGCPGLFVLFARHLPAPVPPIHPRP